MKLKFETQRVAWGRFPVTVICNVDSLPICKNCLSVINDSDYCFYCDNKLFYCENCFTREFLLNHLKTFNRLIHNDKLVFIQLTTDL
jgi:hypothetical protein